MPKLPKNKAIGQINYGGIDNIYRNIVPFGMPNQMLDANIWRSIVRGQPIIMNCISTIKKHIQALPYDIRARDADKSDELKDSIEYHKEILLDAQFGLGFLVYLDMLLDDFLVTPFGGATATPRYSDGKLYDIYAVDAATLRPYNDEKYYVLQYVPELKSQPEFFTQEELIRMFDSPRTELIRQGWGVAPPERIFLALEMLNRGDKYYANLLLDTPEAGILDLGDMSKDSAERWLKSFRDTFTGIDAFKIPVLYEHTVQAKYIPFNRPPTDMMFDAITFKYAQIVAAAFGITTGDVGMKSNTGGSLGSEIRDQRHARSTGYASVKKQIENHINKFLPKELQFWFVDTDDELLVSKGRARSANAVAMRNLIESGTLTPEEARQQLKADGLITIPLPEKVNSEDFDIVKDISGLNDQLALQEKQMELNASQQKISGGVNRKGGQAGFGLDSRRNVRGGKLESVQGKEPLPASSGGYGEIKADVKINVLSKIIKDGFDEILSKMDDVRVRRLIKASLKKYYPMAKSASIENDYEIWKSEYINCLFDKDSQFEGNEIIQKSISDLSESLKEFYQKDRWWRVEPDPTEISLALSVAYAHGLQDVAKDIQRSLYEDGFEDSPDVNKKFDVKSDIILKQLDKKADRIVIQINDGTIYYLTRLSLSSISNNLGNVSDTELNNYLNNDEFLDKAVKEFRSDFREILNERIYTISNLEVERAFNDGKLKQLHHTGIRGKYVVHNGSDIPCSTCKSNIDRGIVELDFEYETNFDERSTVVPSHPDCHCVIKYDMGNYDELNLNYYIGD